MILIDTSAWFDFFRGREPLAGAVDDALATNEAALCGPVETELQRGFVNDRERRKVLPLLDGCHRLSQPDRPRAEAGELGFVLRRRGITPKTLDLVIAIYALSHSAALLTNDRDFLGMQKAGVPLQLVKL
jgi:predicted nucleic acid-binding protein